MSDAGIRSAVAKFVSMIGNDHDMWNFAVLVVQYAQLRANKRGFQHIEAACETYVKTMRAVSGLPSMRDDDDGHEGL